MQGNENISGELKAISTAVAAVPRANVFRVHPDYFAGIEAEFHARLTADRSFPKLLQHEVPAGYFEGLAGSVMAKIRAEVLQSATVEIAEISPLIARIGNENIFAVPQDYFVETLRNASWKPQAKVVSMFSAKKVIRYAAAAVLAGLIGIAIFFAANSGNSTGDAALASVMKDANEIIAKNNFEQTLNTVSENDLADYLASNGDDVNAAVAASYADNADALPGAEDYLLDENTLRDLLGENNLNN